jgi:hypothetical protein
MTTGPLLELLHSRTAVVRPRYVANLGRLPDRKRVNHVMAGWGITADQTVGQP